MDQNIKRQWSHSYLHYFFPFDQMLSIISQPQYTQYILALLFLYFPRLYVLCANTCVDKPQLAAYRFYTQHNYRQHYSYHKTETGIRKQIRHISFSEQQYYPRFPKEQNLQYVNMNPLKGVYYEVFDPNLPGFAPDNQDKLFWNSI